MNRLSDATLNGMTKKQLIEYVRMCEHNYDVAEEMLRQQAENVKDWRPVKHGKWIDSGINGTVHCSECKFTDFFAKRDRVMLFGYCPNCGAKMGGDTDGNV